MSKDAPFLKAKKTASTEAVFLCNILFDNLLFAPKLIFILRIFSRNGGCKGGQVPCPPEALLTYIAA
jgi:hypothetical protein